MELKKASFFLGGGGGALSSSIKKEHNYAYSNAFGLRLCSLVAPVSDFLFWIRLSFLTHLLKNSYLCQVFYSYSYFTT